MTTKEIIHDYKNLPVDISEVEWVNKSDYDSVAAQLALEKLDRAMMAAANIKEYPSARSLLGKIDKWKKASDFLFNAIKSLHYCEKPERDRCPMCEVCEMFEKMKQENEK